MKNDCDEKAQEEVILGVPRVTHPAWKEIGFLDDEVARLKAEPDMPDTERTRELAFVLSRAAIDCGEIPGISERHDRLLASPEKAGYTDVLWLVEEIERRWGQLREEALHGIDNPGFAFRPDISDPLVCLEHWLANATAKLEQAVEDLRNGSVGIAQKRILDHEWSMAMARVCADAVRVYWRFPRDRAQNNEGSELDKKSATITEQETNLYIDDRIEKLEEFLEQTDFVGTVSEFLRDMDQPDELAAPFGGYVAFELGEAYGFIHGFCAARNLSMEQVAGKQAAASRSASPNPTTESRETNSSANVGAAPTQTSVSTRVSQRRQPKMAGDNS